ncbi:MAG: SusC/RagA family TonB-linked outer membrane protein, partial [Cyclobacteriaceae bacterium]
MMKRFTILLGLLFLFGTTWAQKTVTGTVKDDKGSTLVGVNVLLQGTTTGTVTDIDGNYRIDVPGNDAVLVFSSIGYETRTEVVGARSIIDYMLPEDVELLEEVVVSALGFKQQKDKMGATFSQVKTDDITRSGEPMLLNSLSAKASNVRVARTNGDPGAGSTIRIRGANTILGPSDPLIILDGVPISASTIYGGGNNATGGRTGGVSQQSRLNDINPNDIESVQILKGASAASLWGSRAANGVIVITTKNGASGKVKIDFKSTYSFDQVHERIPMQTTWGQGRGGNYSPTQAEAWGDYIPDRSGGADEVDQTGAFFEADDGTIYYPISTKNSQETFVDSNWDAVFQTGTFFQNDLSISGGSDKATYFFSIGRIDQEGIIRESDYDRTNLRLNTRFNLSEWITVTSKAGYTNSNSNRIQQSSNTAGLLLGLLRTPPDFDMRDYRGTYNDGNGGVFPGRHRAYRRYLGGASSNPIYNNPLWTIKEQTATSAVNRFNMSADIAIDPADWLQVILRGGVDNYNDTRAYLFPIGSAGDRNPGIFAEDLIGERELNFDAIAKASFDLSSDIRLQTTIGWNINDRKRRINNSDITGFLVNSKKQTTDLNTAAESSTVSNTKRFIRSNRGYGVLSFDLYDQLFVNLSGT